MTKIILVPDNKVLAEINDGNPDGVYEVDSAYLPYGASKFDVSSWQKIYDMLIEILKKVDCVEQKKFYDQVSELADYALSSAKLNSRRLEAYYADYFKEEIKLQEKSKPRNTKSSILRFE